ncbi:MAG TPA: ABC transporter permease [Anaerolineales bacterium]|nr:ABC transporter permease [Anaerolineales bacterium]
MSHSIDRIKNREDREGSPWTGLTAVLTKEMADHLTGARVLILELLILLTAVGTIFTALKNINTTTDNEFVYLKLFTTAQEPLPPFVFFLAILVPIIAIALSFDSVNGEFNRRTLSRVLAQPVYRDALLLGKFLGGLLTLTLVFSAIWLLIFGIGIFKLGVPPTVEETGRALWFLLATVFYGGIWMALAMAFSTVFRSSATAALASIAVWAFFIFFWNIVVGLLLPVFVPQQITKVEDLVTASQTQQLLSRISPITLYADITTILLQPTERFLGFVLPVQLDRAIKAPLPLGQSVLVIWPQLTGLIAATILIFAICYTLFQRQEIRA